MTDQKKEGLHFPIKGPDKLLGSKGTNPPSFESRSVAQDRQKREMLLAQLLLCEDYMPPLYYFL